MVDLSLSQVWFADISGLDLLEALAREHVLDFGSVLVPLLKFLSDIGCRIIHPCYEK